MRIRAALLFSVLLATPAPAQEPRERAVIDSLRASYQAVTDTNFLASAERQKIAVARTDRDNPYIHFELGFISYRLGELTAATKRYGDAASEFQWAADLRPRWPTTWYYLGLAELSSGEASLIIVENLRQLFGQDALSRAVRAFAHAIEVDPSFSDALVDLANAAMRQRIAPRLVVAQAALRQAGGTAAGRVPEVLLVRGRIERRLLAHDSALAAFHRYVSAGGDSGVGGIELARTHALRGRPDSAVNAYFSGLAGAISATARRELRKDLRWFATPTELTAFDAQAEDSLSPWLRRFWFGRDITDGRRAGERLSEQFRRYQYAVENFGLPSKRRGFDVAFAYRDTSQQEFDDRGVIYLRHGQPSERSSFQGNGFEPNESWLYRQDPPDADLIVHFAAFNDVQDYRLVQSLLDVCTRRQSSDALITTQTTQVGVWRDCVQSRARLSPDYERLARLTDNAAQNVWASERMASIDAVREATTSDSYHLAFETELQPIVSFFAVADAAMRPELHVVFAVPASRLHPREREGGHDYPLSLRMLVYDSTMRMVAALDTMRVFRARGRFGAGVYLTEQLVMRVPAGTYRYSFVIEEPGQSAGDAVSNRDIEIPRLEGAFSASDIVLGREGSGLIWRRPEGEVPLNPLMRFPRDGEARIYYEIYGVPQGTAIPTRVRITRTGGRSIFRRLFGGGGGADLSYTTVTDAPNRTRVSQSMGLRGLNPGRYVLVVEFTEPGTGRKVTRETPFEIESGRATS